MFRFYLTLINLNSCIGLTLGGALQLSHGFALPAPIPSSLPPSGTASAFAPFDTREAG